MRRAITSLLAVATVTTTLLAVASPPNIVLIISDDQAWGDYSFMGHPHIRTPHLDRLASQSLLFRHGYVPSSLCSPSLASILTGLYPHQHRITSNDPPLPPGKTGRAAYADPTFRAQRQELIGFFDQVPTLPRLLADKEYLSLQTGKWWLGNHQRGGFTHGMTHGDPDRGGRHGDEGLKIGRETMQPIFDFIETATAQGKPFLVWYAPMLPHQPHNPPDRLLDHYRSRSPSLPIAKYWAMVEWFDETCGQLLEFLDQKRLAENTVVIYLADNGWIQDPERDRYAPRSKQSQYDGGLRTPILLRWPGRIRPAVSDHLASSLDLAPTILAAAGLKPSPAMSGLNLLDQTAVETRKAIFGEIFTHNAVDVRVPASSLRFRWVVEGDYKLILPAPHNEPKAEPELFNLARDPDESRNLAETEPQTVQRLRQRIQHWWPAQQPKPQSR